MSDGAWGKAFERLREAAAGLPEVEESTSYGTPSLKVRKKFLARVKDPETVVLEQFQEKWKPVFRPELRQNNNLDQFIDSMKR
ncbi:hypothetical protein [Chelativorans xinjiangense]|uniref:hypothetical protein n=1 Tax=Chelativorans xinjiangense TaxID=2681485 RepID=UPI003CCDF1CF